MIKPSKTTNPGRARETRSKSFTNHGVSMAGLRFWGSDGIHADADNKKRLTCRIQIREEMTGISREDYERRLQRVAFLAMTHLNLQVFIVQQFVVRTLVNSKHFVDSREFISQGIFNMESDNFAPLDRKHDILGLRFALSKGDQKEGLFNLRIESFSQDPRSIFIENIGTYRTMVRKDNLEGLTDNFGKTYAYVETNVVPFLAQFDDAP